MHVSSKKKVSLQRSNGSVPLIRLAWVRCGNARNAKVFCMTQSSCKNVLEDFSST